MKKDLQALAQEYVCVLTAGEASGGRQQRCDVIS